MSSKKTYAAYVPTGCQFQGAEVLFETASDKYGYAGLVLPLDGSGQWRAVKLGFSHESVARRTRTEARRILGAEEWKLSSYSGTSLTWEVTAPAVADYFGHHRVAVTEIFIPGEGWKDANLRAGKSHLRRMAKEGITTVRVTGRGSVWAQGERPGVHVADFTMDQLLKSMNARAKSA